MLKRLVLIIAASLLFLSGGSAQASSEDFQRLSSALLAAHDGPEPLVFQEGTDFLAPLGTIIFLSREEGIQRLVALARAGEPELAMLYLPNRGAWVTTTKERGIDTVRSDSRYVDAAMLIEPVIELWHTHNAINPDPASPPPSPQLLLKWTMPTAQDLQQLYDNSHGISGVLVRGNIAHIYGTTEYWNDTPGWAEPRYIRTALVSLSNHIRNEVGEMRIEDLENFPQEHEEYEGMMKFRVTRYPD